MSEPRVLVVMQAQWPRALLLAALRESGYDASGAATLEEALAYPAEELRRGPVQLIILDHHVSGDNSLVRDLLERHPVASPLYLESALRSGAERPGARLRYPISIGEIVRQIENLLARRRVGSETGLGSSGSKLKSLL